MLLQPTANHQRAIIVAGASIGQIYERPDGSCRVVIPSRLGSPVPALYETVEGVGRAEWRVWEHLHAQGIER